MKLFKMSVAWMCGLAVLSAGSVLGMAGEAAAPFPKYDIAQACKVQANYAFAATLGQADLALELSACSTRERENMVLAQTLWPRASRKDTAECLELADNRYGRLARCLETSRSLRGMR